MNKTLDDVSISLTPFPHYEDSLSKDYWRVPLKISDENYIVFLGQNLKRIFNSKNLPDHLKLAVAFIKASSISNNKADSNLYELDLFIPDHMNNELYKETGWRASESWFIVILSNNQINELAGYYDEA